MGGAVISGFPYVLPKNRVDDLVAYCSNRKNSRRTKALNDNVCPRVHEFRVAFGDYVEGIDPTATSN